MAELKVFDAFSGIGGFRKGAELSTLDGTNFTFVGSADSDPLCRAVYERLYDTKSETMFERIEDIHTFKNPTKTLIPDFDILLGGFPCQPFANIGNKLGLNDHRGALIFYISELLKFYQPRFFILENVQKMRNLGKGQTLEYVTQLLIRSGYSVCVWDLCASDYGVPQQRRRLIFCGVRDSRPRVINLTTPSKIPDSQRQYKTTWHLLDRVMPKEHLVPPKTAETVFRRNEKWQGNLEINRLVARPLTATMAKWHRANQDNYFSEDFIFAKSLEEASSCATEPNGKRVRRISLSEGLRLQGFDNDASQVFADLGIRPTAGFRLIGNAIPIPLVKSIISEFIQNF
jgi:DNA (cytosine-5)-methyltransferase 1